jgi:hypothetical protein
MCVRICLLFQLQTGHSREYLSVQVPEMLVLTILRRCIVGIDSRSTYKTRRSGR